MNFLQLRGMDKGSIRDVGLLIIRIIALSLAFHGFHKLSNLSGTAAGFAHVPVGSSAPTFFALFAGLVQLLVGIFLFIGLFTRWAGLAGTLLFLFIILAVNIPFGGFMDAKTGGLAFEPALLYFTVSIALFFTGAGRYSIDHKLGSVVTE